MRMILFLDLICISSHSDQLIIILESMRTILFLDLICISSHSDQLSIKKNVLIIETINYL